MAQKKRKTQKKQTKARANNAQDARSPFSKNTTTFIEKTVTIIALIFPLTTLPHIMSIYSSTSIDKLSVLSWGFFFVLTIPLLGYAMILRDKPLTTMYALWCAMYLALFVSYFLVG